MVLCVAGCLPAGTTGQDVAPKRLASLLEGRIQVPAPSGYCIDEASLRNHARAGFVLIAGCDGLMGLPSGTLVPPAILTVSALVPKSGEPQAQDMLRALEGTQILDRSEQGGLILVQVDDNDLVPEGSPSRHWRGAFQMGDVLLTLAAYGDQASGAAGKALLSDLATQIRSATRRAEQARAKAAPKVSRDKPAEKSWFQRIIH